MFYKFWKKTCEDKGVTPKPELVKLEKQIQKLEKDIEGRKELIEIYSNDSCPLNDKHIARHEAGIISDKQRILDLKEKLKNLKKEFDK